MGFCRAKTAGFGNDIARTLYHKYAAPMPIYDFHCHLSPQEIADDRRFDNLGQIW
ncbi:glucuronate isomerase, partial [Salmonella enterica subsp. enterica serovar Anatum]|nr:glucuronate isomerase [Salmonella enterica subsp. enterica serovar Anatum]